MTGTVVAVNQSNGMVVVHTDGGEYSVIEPIGGYDVELGDTVSGNLLSEGSGKIRNVTQYETMDVMVQGVYSSKSSAIASIR
jgi:hypothetical protein